MAGGVPGVERKLEYKQPVPGPGAVLGVSDANAAGQYPGAMGFSSSTNSSPVFGSPDFQSPSFNPGLQPGGSAGAAPTAGRKRPAKRSRK